MERETGLEPATLCLGSGTDTPLLVEYTASERGSVLIIARLFVCCLFSFIIVIVPQSRPQITRGLGNASSMSSRYIHHLDLVLTKPFEWHQVGMGGARVTGRTAATVHRRRGIVVIKAIMLVV